MSGTRHIDWTSPGGRSKDLLRHEDRIGDAGQLEALALLGGPFVELHCLGSGIHFELLGSGFLRIAWIMFFFKFELLTETEGTY